jgi:hypothetical protein
MAMASIALWRIGISELARWACGYGTIGKLHPIYVEVTEKRDNRASWRTYSSCADLGHWLAKRCGVRQPWVNRDDDHFAGPWEPIKNVGKLAVASVPPPGGYEPDRGDIWILSNTWPQGTDSHVCVCLGANPEKPGEYLTANYGASGLVDVESPGAKISSKLLTREGGSYKYGNKRLAEVLDVPNLVGRISVKPDMSGPVEWTDEWTGEVRDALEASVD